jgi:2'-hydroxyisoflavone reductase
MRLLVLGGTKFLGRHTVDAALAAGHEVTAFTRGRTNPELSPEAEHLRGDREGDLAPLRGRRWDGVIDTSGYVPHVVRASASALRDETEQYLFVSSISVYADFSAGADEDAPTAALGDLPADELREDYSNYGPLKALCEEAVRGVFGDRALIVRPGLIAGPHDPTGRFTYWPHRVARGGDVVAPAPPERTVQFVDVRDLAAWMLDLCERKTAGTFNATNPGVSWRELLETCRQVTRSDARFVWLPDEFLVERGIGEWMELPLWIQDPEWVGLHLADVSRALAAGLELRPLEETVRATLERAEPTDEAGLTPEREQMLLKAWRARV